MIRPRRLELSPNEIRLSRGGGGATVRFPKVQKSRDDFLKAEYGYLARSRNVVADVLLGIALLVPLQNRSLAAPTEQDEPDKSDPSTAVAKAKTIKVGRHLGRLITELKSHGLFSYLAHYSHVCSCLSCVARITRGPDPVIFVRNVMLITVDAQHARANNTSQIELARAWLANFQRALPML
jgi:hypothetical protein